MNLCLMWCSLTARIRTVLLLCVIGPIFSVPTIAQTNPSVVLFVGHLNTDCYPDTVRGQANGPRTYLPDKIYWGVPDSTNPMPCDADSTRGGHPPGAHLFPLTPLVYPSWPELRGSVAFEQYNTNDEITDVILYLWGKSPLTGQDTSHSLVIYGQLALDTLPVLMVNTITTGTQTTPFFAMGLRIGTEFIEPDFRDMGGRISYELPRVNFSTAGEPPHIPQPPGVQTGESATVAAYPNPAELWTRLESSPLSEGEYTITVMGVNGRIYHTQQVRVAGGGQIDRELDLGGLVSGYYIVRLYREGTFISSHPIVIVR